MATPLPENVASFSVEEMVSATTGRLVQRGASAVTGVSTDTRARLAGKAFVALRGERFDAHELLEHAVQAGAACLIVERDIPAPSPDVAILRVESTLKALGALARHHRRRWAGQVVAVAGSAGKTTTRAAITAVLEALRPGRVHATSGNLNNQVGLPLTLLATSAEHDVCVLEVGTNQLGEVPLLAQICEPDIGVLTLIDLEHSEGLGDLDSIEQEEGALVRSLSQGGCAIGNGDDPRVKRQVEGASAGARILYGTGEECAYRLVGRRALGHDGIRIVGRRGADAPIEFDSALIGEPGALASLCAWAVAERVEGRVIEAATLTSALSDVGESGRLQRVLLADGTLVLDDTYNANPASVRKSIETAAELARLRSGRLWLVLGEMRELGSESEREHRSMGEFAARHGASGLFVIGLLAEPAVDAASGGGLSTTFCIDATDAIDPLLDRLRGPDVVLVKASRGVRAERVVEGLIRARGRSH